jgi:N-acetylglucosamine-6-phosphate deacetylase
MSGISFVEALHYQTDEFVRIEFSEGYISRIIPLGDVTGEKARVIVAPGLFDNQVNGYVGVDFSEDGLTPELMEKVVEAIRRDGITSFLPTFITNSHENLLRNFRLASSTLRNINIRNSVPGFHLEGPYISPEYGYYGTHPPEFVRKADWNEFMMYQEAAGGNIIQVTVAPEVEGAIGFIEKCSKNGIVVSIGHSNASAEVINMAVKKGARLSTHLGNGLANMIDRHRNAIWPQLANDLLMPSIIADGHHLLPEEVKVFFRVKGPDNMFLTSDVSPLSGMAPGKYTYMGSEVIYTPDGFLRNSKMNCLAGASQTLKRGVENMMEFTGCSLSDAINMASGNVAKACLLSDRGTIEPGKRADLILFELDKNRISIRNTIVKGRIVFPNTTLSKS